MINRMGFLSRRKHWKIMIGLAILIGLSGLGVRLRSATVFEADVCVYGGTSAGVAAAVQAARLGKTVVLAEFGNHLGGMSSGGYNCRGRVEAEDSVGLGAYNMDSHNCQRIVKNGHAENEGDVQVGAPRPYPIAYRSIVPKASECENLLVPVCLSASHIAYGSIRMEPVFMVLGHSAATAAALAIDGETSVQDVDIYELQSQLIADRQILDWPRGL